MPMKVDPELSKHRFTGTPLRMSSAILSLAAELSPHQQPQFVDIAPEPDALPGECFFNVESKVARDGGSIIYGWAIWEWPRVFIEAEHHAVWSNGTRLVDVTPNDPGIRRVLFLPDPDRQFDAVAFNRQQNVRRALNPSQEITDFISTTDRYARHRQDHSYGRIVHLDDTAEVLKQRARYARLGVLVWLAQNTRRNDPCFCASGKKFKICCARFFQPA